MRKKISIRFIRILLKCIYFWIRFSTIGGSLLVLANNENYLPLVHILLKTCAISFPSLLTLLPHPNFLCKTFGFGLYEPPSFISYGHRPINTKAPWVQTLPLNSTSWTHTYLQCKTKYKEVFKTHFSKIKERTINYTQVKFEYNISTMKNS